jgi:hypothetical protein
MELCGPMHRRKEEEERERRRREEASSIGRICQLIGHV